MLRPIHGPLIAPHRSPNPIANCSIICSNNTRKQEERKVQEQTSTAATGMLGSQRGSHVEDQSPAQAVRRREAGCTRWQLARGRRAGGQTANGASPTERTTEAR